MFAYGVNSPVRTMARAPCERRFSSSCETSSTPRARILGSDASLPCTRSWKTAEALFTSCARTARSTSISARTASSTSMKAGLPGAKARSMRSTPAGIGSPDMDLVVRAPHLPVPGETVLGGGFSTVPGGKGANQAVAAARLGARTAMIGCVGEDAFGRQLRAGLEADHVDVSAVRTVPARSSGVALIVVDDGGRNGIVVVSGANGQLAPEDID